MEIAQSRGKTVVDWLLMSAPTSFTPLYRTWSGRFLGHCRYQAVLKGSLLLKDRLQRSKMVGTSKIEHPSACKRSSDTELHLVFDSFSSSCRSQPSLYWVLFENHLALQSIMHFPYFSCFLFELINFLLFLRYSPILSVRVT